MSWWMSSGGSGAFISATAKNKTGTTPALLIARSVRAILAGIHTLEQQPQRERSLAKDGNGNHQWCQSISERGRNESRERGDDVARTAGNQYGADNPGNQGRPQDQITGR